jgi:hypothetical protein
LSSPAPDPSQPSRSTLIFLSLASTVPPSLRLLYFWYFDSPPAKSTTIDPNQEQASSNVSPSQASPAWSEAGLGQQAPRNSSQQLPPAADIFLRISPAAGSATFGYIFIAENKCHQQDAITAYFYSAGREVMVHPCPYFANFLTEHSLQERNVSLIMDLPCYIIPTGTRIFQAHQYDALLNQDWLPAPLDLSSLNVLSRSSSSRNENYPLGSGIFQKQSIGFWCNICC